MFLVKGKTVVPKGINEVKLISSGKILENSKTVGQCKTPFGEVAGGVTVMHVVVQPSLAKTKTGKVFCFFFFFFYLSCLSENVLFRESLCLILSHVLIVIFVLWLNFTSCNIICITGEVDNKCVSTSTLFISKLVSD